MLLSCALLSLTAELSPATSDTSDVPSVTIQIPSNPANADGWNTPPIIAQVVPQGPGIVYYRFGAGPGPWQPSYGTLVIPPGKQTLSVVLIAPDGTAGTVQTLTTRSDIHAIPVHPDRTSASSASSLSTTSSASTSSTATYSGAPSVAGAVTVQVLVGRQLGTLVRRLGGNDRYDTGAIISANEPGNSGTVIIATGEKFPDALTASGLAGCLNAPVLLVTKNSVPPKTAAEIKRLGATRAIICGGPPSVSSAVARQLSHMGLAVSRLAGRTRYETAVAVARRIQQLTGNNSRVFIARGDAFQDALVVAPLAYATRSPILLSTVTKLHDSTAAQLTSAKYGNATIIGGGIGSNAENGVRNRIGTVDRWAGGDVYDTSVEVAAQSVLSGSESWKYVGLARGDLFPDALCGGVMCGKEHGVILLTPPTHLDPTVANALSAHTADVRMCEIYGSNQAITDGVFSQVSAIFH